MARLPLVVDDDGPRLALGRIPELAAEHGLPVYDATYLDLAVRLNPKIAAGPVTLAATNISTFLIYFGAAA